MSGNARPRKSGRNRTDRRRRYFARRIIHPWMRPGIMRKHIYTGVMGNVFFILFNGIFFIYYAKRIGLSDAQLALMGGVSAFLLSVQLLSAALTQRGGRRKRLWFWCALSGRVARIVGVIVSFVLWHAGFPGAGLAIIGCIWIASLLGALAFPPWMSWLADIIPHGEHGGFWGRRTQWISLSVMVVTLLAALVMDNVPETWKLHASLVILLSAGIIGIVDIFIHGTIPEPPMEDRHHGKFLEQALEPLRDRGFRPWLVFNVCWTYSMCLGGVVSLVFIVDDLEIKWNFIGGVIALTCVAEVASILTAGRTGKLVDRYGPKKVLTWGHLFWSAAPLFLMLATPKTALIYLAALSAMSGAACKASMTAANKLITRYPPPGRRAMYVAVSSCLGSLAGGLGALTASGILAFLGEDWRWSVWGKTIGAFHVVFLVSLVLRFAFTACLIDRINNPGRQKATQNSKVQSEASPPQAAGLPGEGG